MKAFSCPAREEKDPIPNRPLQLGTHQISKRMEGEVRFFATILKSRSHVLHRSARLPLDRSQMTSKKRTP